MGNLGKNLFWGAVVTAAGLYGLHYSGITKPLEHKVAVMSSSWQNPIPRSERETLANQLVALYKPTDDKVTELEQQKTALYIHDLCVEGLDGYDASINSDVDAEFILTKCGWFSTLAEAKHSMQ